MAYLQKVSTKTKRVFVPIIPLNSKVKSLQQKKQEVQQMVNKNPLLEDLMLAFDCGVQ